MLPSLPVVTPIIEKNIQEGSQLALSPSVQESQFISRSQWLQQLVEADKAVLLLDPIPEHTMVSSPGNTPSKEQIGAWHMLKHSFKDTL